MTAHTVLSPLVTNSPTTEILTELAPFRDDSVNAFHHETTLQQDINSLDGLFLNWDFSVQRAGRKTQSVGSVCNTHTKQWNPTVNGN